MTELKNDDSLTKRCTELMRHYGILTKRLATLAFNRKSLITLGGLIGGLVVSHSSNELYFFVKDFNIPKNYFDIGTQIIPVYFALKGVTGNIAEYGKYIIPPKLFRKLDLDIFAEMHMASAGLTLHYAGEYYQNLIFGFDNPHSYLPYLLFNVPGFVMIGQSTIGVIRKY